MKKREYIDNSTKKLIERMQDLKIEQDKADIKEMAKESESTLNLAVEQTALAQEIIPFSQEIKDAMRGSFRNSTSVDPIRKKELKETIYNMYTSEGIANYFRDFTSQEIYEAMTEIAKGKW